jgi:SAM-dependent methyltransferase
MSAQDRTLDQYHELMQINAVSHILRAARDVGVFSQLGKGQHTAQQLFETLRLEEGPAQLLLDSLLSIGILERYGDDYAISSAARLLSQYDTDLGDANWSMLQGRLQRNEKSCDLRRYYEGIAATQWIHTPAAMQAAEILDIANIESDSLKLIDLGCGSGVWSCAMAFAHPAMELVFVDELGSLGAAQSTASSIELHDRFKTIVGDPLTAALPEDEKFDFALIAQRLHALDDTSGDELLERAVTLLKTGGQLVVIDLFRGPAKPNLCESVEAIKLELQTKSGRMRTLEESKERLSRVGLSNIQFTFLANSRINLGLIVGERAK